MSEVGAIVNGSVVVIVCVDVIVSVDVIGSVVVEVVPVVETTLEDVKILVTVVSPVVDSKVVVTVDGVVEVVVLKLQFKFCVLQKIEYFAKTERFPQLLSVVE
jgi:hypothetical protein